MICENISEEDEEREIVSPNGGFRPDIPPGPVDDALNDVNGIVQDGNYNKAQLFCKMCN